MHYKNEQNCSRFLGILVSGLILISRSASAGDVYVTVSGGAALPHDSTLSGETTGSSQDAARISDSTYFIAGAVGYRYNPTWRVEGELSYQNYDVKEIKNDDTGTFGPGSGDLDLLGFGVNGYYDYQTKTAFTPYVGVGLAAVYVEANDIQRPGRSTLNESAFAPMPQLMLGVGYKVSETVDMTFGYRLQGLFYLSGDHTRANGTKVEGDLDALWIHNLTVGLRYTF